MSAPAVDLWVLNILDGNQFPGHWNFQAPLAVIEGDRECKKEIRLNTANLQLEGLIMAVAALSDTLTAKGVLTHQEMSAALGQAERAVEQDDDHELSDPNRAATLFPIRVLLLANEAAQRGKKFTFSDYAELVGKLT